MWLRWLVSSWVRQQGQQTLRNLFTEAIRGESPPRGGRGPARRPSEGLISGEREGVSPSTETPPRPPCSIAFLFALDLEAAGLVERLTRTIRTRCAAFVEHDGFLGEERVIVAETGVGMEAARRAAADVIAMHQPAWIVSAGYAGGLADDVRRGHFIMAETVVDERGRELSVGLKVPPEVLSAQKSLHAGRLVTVDRLIRDEADKRELGRRFDAVACDMETWAVAETCAQLKTRFLSVRIITDAVDDKLPIEIENLLDQKSIAGKLGAVAGALLNRPSSVKDMWKLHEEAQRGSTRLGKFLESAAAQLRP